MKEINYLFHYISVLFNLRFCSHYKQFTPCWTHHKNNTIKYKCDQFVNDSKNVLFINKDDSIVVHTVSQCSPQKISGARQSSRNLGNMLILIQ